MPKPSFFDPAGRSKHDAWSSLGTMTKDEAMLGYIELIDQLVESFSFDDNEFSDVFKNFSDIRRSKANEKIYYEERFPLYIIPDSLLEKKVLCFSRVLRFT